MPEQPLTHGLKFILAVPGRRYGDFVDLLEPIHSKLCANAPEEVLGETIWNKLRLILAHDPVVAKDATTKRDPLCQTRCRLQIYGG